MLRERKHPLDLPGAIGVIANAAAHHRGAPLQAGHQVLVSTGHIRPAFLQEDARLEVDRPGIRMVKKLMRLHGCSISGALRVVHDTEWALYALCLG